jgi:hypothetical protein
LPALEPGAAGVNILGIYVGAAGGMKNLQRVLLWAAFMGVSAPLWAHHSAAQFDFAQTVEVGGVVELIEVRNPHIKLILSVEAQSGRHKAIEYEGHSRNNVYRRGWRPDDVQAGDRITIAIAPLRSGSDAGGYIKSMTTSAGKEF